MALSNYCKLKDDGDAAVSVEVENRQYGAEIGALLRHMPCRSIGVAPSICGGSIILPSRQVEPASRPKA